MSDLKQRNNIDGSSQASKIAICGAGPVGQALALMLHQAGFSAHDIVLFDAKTSEQANQDARSIALSFGSDQLLNQLNARPQKSTAIKEIHVSRRKHFGRSFITAEDYQLPALGYVARYGDIVSPLELALQRAGIVTHRPVQVSRIEEDEHQVTIHLQDGSTHHAAFAIQAEGGSFSDQEERSQHHDYQQTAVIAHVSVDRPILHRAFERFTDQGPIALLPQEDGYALVWCMRPDAATDKLALNDTAFLSDLQVAFGERLGQFISTSKRVAYALGLNAHAQATQRTVRIGNAAQTLHPVAGQGLNLGLRDAFCLAQCLAKDSSPQALSHFLSLRKTDRQTSIKLTDAMAKIFASSQDGSLAQSLLGLSLGAVDLLPPVKKMLVEQMMFGWRG
nr:FAD-dependent monooxygenase [uncultured Undibacterium sp.]